jgi:4-amino-4-deoxy-L-arabinose transferase-like glycosyltransferase
VTGWPGPHLQRPILVLAVICLLAAIPRVYLASTRPLNYDEYWHVFVARQDTRAALSSEWRNTAHPPLYYWLLKLSMAAGWHRLAYRLVSLLAGLAAVLVVWLIGRRLARDPAVPWLAALAFALALPAIVTSFEVRAYMVSALCALGSFACLLSMLDDRAPRGIPGFAVLACLAVLSSYAAAFFVLAALAVLAYASAMTLAREARLPAIVRERPVALALGLLLPALTTAVLYRTHARGFARRQAQMSHLPAFQYRPDQECIGAYVVRSIHNEINLFLPAPLGDAAALPLFVLTVAAVGSAAIWLARRQGDLLRRVPTLLVLLMAGALLAASVRGVYPFGGRLRQQFVLFPFLVVAWFQLVDAGMVRWPAWRRPLAAAGVAAVCLSGAWHLGGDLLTTPGELCGRQMTLYRNAFGTPRAVYTDSFSTILLFAHHDRWDWRAAPAAARGARPDRYVMSRDGQEVLVWRQDHPLDLADEQTYRRVGETLRSSGLPSTTVFSVRWTAPGGRERAPASNGGAGGGAAAGDRPAHLRRARRLRRAPGEPGSGSQRSAGSTSAVNRSSCASWPSPTNRTHRSVAPASP